MHHIMCSHNHLSLLLDNRTSSVLWESVAAPLSMAFVTESCRVF